MAKNVSEEKMYIFPNVSVFVAHIAQHHETLPDEATYFSQDHLGPVYTSTLAKTEI